MHITVDPSHLEGLKSDFERRGFRCQCEDGKTLTVAPVEGRRGRNAYEDMAVRLRLPTRAHPNVSQGR